jgi:hypothetical protein
MKRERSFALELLIRNAWLFRDMLRKKTYHGDYMRGLILGQYMSARSACYLVKAFGNIRASGKRLT